MPRGTPFHERTRALCETYSWKDWSGYHAVCTYGLSPDREYNAIRQGAAMIDVTPLFKYDISGSDAGAFLARLLVRDVRKLKPGRMSYLCWCDADGKVIDDGTCARLSEEAYRLTSAAPAMHWLQRHARAFDVTIRDRSDSIAALALQGPTSRELLRQVCDADVDALRFFGQTETTFAGGAKGWLSRTGYTGDLGYELWVDNADALGLYDALLEVGKNYGAVPVGLDALDISRVEAGFILRGIDYVGANEAMIESQKSSPFEIGLGWTVKLNRDENFIGKEALQREKDQGSPWALVGLDIDWDALETLYARHDLPTQVPNHAWRTAIPVYGEGRQVGRATSGSWSPMLKKNLALATVEQSAAAPGTKLLIEWTVEWSREVVPATVIKTPFFDPDRKRA